MPIREYDALPVPNVQPAELRASSKSLLAEEKASPVISPPFMMFVRERGDD